jgi:hypothetical protein
MKGKKHSIEARQKMRKARKKAIIEGRTIVPSRKGIPMTKEQKERISRTLCVNCHRQTDTWGRPKSTL